jgi:hypothetical protein
MKSNNVNMPDCHSLSNTMSLFRTGYGFKVNYLKCLESFLRVRLNEETSGCNSKFPAPSVAHVRPIQSSMMSWLVNNDLEAM